MVCPNCFLQMCDLTNRVKRFGDLLSSEDLTNRVCVGGVWPEGILPVNAPAHGSGRLAVSEILTALHKRDERQAPRRFAVVTNLRIEVGKESRGIDDTLLITHRHVPIAFGEGRSGHPGGLLWYWVNGIGIE